MEGGKKKNRAVLKGITRGGRWCDSLLDIRWTWPRAEMELVSSGARVETPAERSGDAEKSPTEDPSARSAENASDSVKL